MLKTQVSAAILLAFALVACAGPKTASLSDTLHPAKNPGPKVDWTRKMPGLITDLKIAETGVSILVATVHDSENQRTGEGKYQLIGISRAGKELWSNRTKYQVKTQALSPDGELAVVSTNDGTLFAVDAAGKQAPRQAEIEGKAPDGNARWGIPL